MGYDDRQYNKLPIHRRYRRACPAVEYPLLFKVLLENSLISHRRPKEGDWEFLVYHMFDSPERFFFSEEVDMPVDIDLYKKRTEFVEPEKLNYTCFAIENDEGRHVGIANLFGVNERHGTFDPIGIQVTPVDRGKRYAAAAFRMLGEYMFNERRMHKWNSGYIEGNESSAALHKKAGFSIEGIKKDMHYHEGRYWDVVICGMTEAQFYKNEKLLPKLCSFLNFDVDGIYVKSPSSMMSVRKGA